MTVAELTAEHVGWLIKVAEPDPLFCDRTFVLAGIRSWTYQDKTTVGLIDPSEAHGRIAGTERPYAPDAECELIRRVRKPRRQREG